jgi:hypothetical protein
VGWVGEGRLYNGGGRPEGTGAARSRLRSSDRSFVGALVAPMQEWGGRARLVAGTLTVVASTALAFAIVARLQPIFSVADSAFYLSIARGDTAHVMQPWASRQMGALVVAGMARMTGWTIERSFVVQGVVSLMATLAGVCWLMMRTRTPRWMLMAMVVLPSWVPLVQYLALPDLWYAALLTVVFVLLAEEQVMAGCLMMLPLMLSRESTSLLLLCWLVAGWSVMRWRHRVVAVGAAAVGSVVVGRLSAQAQPNVEHLPGAVYLVAKVPWNFLQNVVGIVPWSNVNANHCEVPIWSMALHYGPVQRVGVCGFSFSQQLVATANMLSGFGLLPLLVGLLWWRHRKWAGRGLLLRFSLLYGTACLVLAPVLGAGFQHLVGYAWPLFLVALPLLFNEFAERRTEGEGMAAVAFLVLHVGLCASSYWLGMWGQLAVGMAAWGVGYGLLRRWWGPVEREEVVGAGL